MVAIEPYFFGYFLFTTLSINKTHSLDASECQTIEDRFYEHTRGTNWQAFYNDVQQTLKPWKAKVILNILKRYAENPSFEIRHYTTHGIRVRSKKALEWPQHDRLLPYALSAPKTVINA